MDYGEILKKSWKIIWKFKVLWIFGFLASCGNGSAGGGSGNSGARFSADEGSWGGGQGFSGNELGEGFNRFFDQVGNFFGNIGTFQWIMIALGILVLILALVLLTLAISTVGKIGLVRGAWKADEGVEKLRFGELLSDSFRYFWRVILFTVGLTVLGWIVGFLLIFPTLLFTVVTLGLGLCCLIPVLIVFGWGLTIYINQVVVAIVGEDLDVMEGVKRAWQLVRDNLAAYAVMGLIISIGMAVITILLMTPLIAVALPFIIGAVNASASHSANGLLQGGIISLALLCIYIPIAIVAGAILQSYVWTAWTLVFRRLSGRQGATLEEKVLEPESNQITPEAESGEILETKTDEGQEPPSAGAEPPQESPGEEPQQ